MWQIYYKTDSFKSAINGGFTTIRDLFYEINSRYFAYTPKSIKQNIPTLQSRNTFIGNYIVTWCQKLLEPVAKKFNLFIFNDVVCEELGLVKSFRADLAFFVDNEIYQKISNIKLILEIKMSMVNNYEFIDNYTHFMGECKTHKSSAFLTRSDSMLKAIGEAINIGLSSKSAKTIPIIILSNTYISNNYLQKVDYLWQCRVLQNAISLNHFIDSILPLNCFQTTQNIQKLEKTIDNILKQNFYYFLVMVDKNSLGKLIKEFAKCNSETQATEYFFKNSKGNKVRHTKTHFFGVGVRIGCNSSKSYNSRLYENLQRNNQEKCDNNLLLPQNLNKIFCCSGEKMLELLNNSIRLMLTSPTYNVGKDDVNLSLNKYLSLLRNVLSETYRVLVYICRVCMNISNIGRRPHIPLTIYINKIMLEIGFLVRGEIICNKNINSGVSLAKGSFKSASNPVSRDTLEYNLVFSKDEFKREKKLKGKQDSISKENFMEWSKSIWRFSAVSTKKIWYPAQFPITLSNRLNEFYSFRNDIILYHFMKLIALVVLNLKRKFIGYEINKDYIALANRRINNEAIDLFAIKANVLNTNNHQSN